MAIRGIRVLDSEKGLFVSMPQSKDREGKYHDIAFPVTGDLRQQISRAVLDGYAQAIERRPLKEALREGAAKAAEQTTVPVTGSREKAVAALELA